MKIDFTASSESNLVALCRGIMLAIIGLLLGPAVNAMANPAFDASHLTAPILSVSAPPPVAAYSSSPVFTSSEYTYSLPDIAILGTSVGTVTATDADGGSIAYAISAGNTNKAFAINAATGAITVAKTLNYHTQSDYALTVTATDGTALSGEATVMIKVTAGTTITSFGSIAWSNIASHPYGTHEVHGEAVNGKFYVFGGYDVLKRPAYTPTKRSYVYDPATNKWSAIADLPHTPNGTNFGGITHVGLTTDGTDIYFAGGYTSNADGTGQLFGTKQVWRYNVALNTYTALPSLPSELAAGQLRYLQGKLHYVGGANKARQDIADHYELDLDDLGAGWKVAAPLSNPRNHPGSAVCEGKLYFIGGAHHQDEQTETQKSVEAYDPASKTWSYVAEIPTAVDHISSSVVVIGGRILVIGGETSHNVRTSKIQAYDPASNSWSYLSNMPASTAAGAAGVINNTLCYTGGNFTKSTYKGIPGDAPAPQEVSSFTLWNANSKSDIQPLLNNSTLNLATLPTKNLNIRANTSPSTVGSVVFELTGTQSKIVTESRATYDLMGDDGSWTPATGSYTLKATPYSGLGGSGTAGKVLTVSFTVVNQANQGALVTNITSSSGRSYALAELAVGAQHYTDRTYTVTSVPSTLAGATLVRTANDDKKSAAAALLGFELGQQATVYVAYDPRGGALPAWLSGWQKLTERVGVDDSKIAFMDLYSKTFAAGAVSLGGNLASPAAGAETNYFVIAKATTPPAGALVSNLTASSGRSYALAELAVGAQHYTDRTYTVTSVPSMLAGATLVRTANDDKKSASAALLGFELGQQATVYVAYDPRGGTLPAWLSGWQKLAERVGVDDSKIAFMDLYSKTFAAGVVSLGGNLASPAAGAETGYFVIAKATTSAAALEQHAQATLTEKFERTLVMSAYPNPATGGKVYMAAANFQKHEALTITLYDALGRAVATQDTLADDQGAVQVEVQQAKNLEPGFYILRASGLSGKAQCRLLVQ